MPQTASPTIQRNQRANQSNQRAKREPRLNLSEPGSRKSEMYKSKTVELEGSSHESNRDSLWASSSKVCWIGEKPSPYQPDHQVELLHLQAEVDVLMVKLQAAGQQLVKSAN